MSEDNLNAPDRHRRTTPRTRVSPDRPDYRTTPANRRGATRDSNASRATERLPRRDENVGYASHARRPYAERGVQSSVSRDDRSVRTRPGRDTSAYRAQHRYDADTERLHDGYHAYDERRAVRDGMRAGSGSRHEIYRDDSFVPSGTSPRARAEARDRGRRATAAEVRAGAVNAGSDRMGRTTVSAREARAAVKEEAPAKKKSRYIPALDGMRTLAVLAVIAYHMGFGWASGGLLGVTMFFVLSGYLITGLLIAEWDRSEKINLPNFWLRRVRRLVPAIVTCVFVCAALFTIFNHALLTKMRPDMIPSLLFFNNWWQILQDVSYFDALGSPSPLTHFWSLAIEEQFYLVWPVLLMIVFKVGINRTIVRRGVLVLAALSVIEMALLYGGPETDPSRVYYGTDTRALSLLIGAWLAFAWPSGKLGEDPRYSFEGTRLLILDIVGVVALVGLVIMLIACDGMSPFMYRGGILLASVLTMIVIAVISHPDSRLAKVFALKPLVWIGIRSYGIYLWHYPILLLMIPVSSTEATPWWLYLVALAVIIAVSAISFTFIEDPIRKGALGRMASEVAQRVSTWGEVIRTHIVQIAAAIIIFAVAIGGVIFVPETNALEGADILKEAEEQQSDPSKANVVAPLDETYTVLLIGDSVSVRAIPYFEQTFPGGHIDSAVNRQLYTGAEVYAYYRDSNVVGDVVVFALGTNGQATDEQLDELIGAVGSDKNIYLVNTRSTTSWMNATNTALANATTRYDNVYLIDWYSYSAGRGDVFDGDGTHLSESGAQEYISLIQTTIAQTTGLPEEPTPEVLTAREEYKEHVQELMEQSPSVATTACINVLAKAIALN